MRTCSVHVVDVGHPGILCLGRRLDRLEVLCPQVGEAIGDPVDVLLDGDHHVADHGRAARSGDGEEIRKAGDGDAEVGTRSVGPLVPQRAASPAADVDAEQGAGHGIEAGGEDDAVEVVLGGPGSHTLRSDRLDWLAAEIDQGDVVAVERLVVVGVDADVLGAEGIVLREEGSATAASQTVARILDRKNSAAVSLASFRVRRSVYAAAKPRPPRCQRISYSRCRSSAGTARADWLLTETTKPTRDSRVRRRNSA
jgi:hypothetical protein